MRSWIRQFDACSIAIAFAMLAPAPALAQPTTQPAGSIVEVTLEDPITPESRCYLDLDTGKTHPRGETQADMVAARQFVHEHGIDLMCETREPARGFVVYGMSLKAADDTLDHPPAFVEMRRMFEKFDPAPFDFVTPDSWPKTYRFRTSDGAMGLLEVVETMQNPTGLRLRYRLVSEPPLAPLVRNPNRGRAVQYAMLVARQELQVKQLRETYGDNHPTVIEAQRQLDLSQDIAKLSFAEPDPRLFSLKSMQIRQAYQLAQLREKFPDTSAAIKNKLREIEILKIQIQDAQARPPQRNAGIILIPAVPAPGGNLGIVRTPATRPAPVNPATQPSAKDFHL